VAALDLVVADDPQFCRLQIGVTARHAVQYAESFAAAPAGSRAGRPGGEHRDSSHSPGRRRRSGAPVKYNEATVYAHYRPAAGSAHSNPCFRTAS